MTEKCEICGCGPHELHDHAAHARYRHLRQAEADPTGRHAHEPGSKLDAGKVQVFRGALSYFPYALAAVARVSEIGAAKYAWRGWETVPNGIERYSDALARHLLAEGHEDRDFDTGQLHAAHLAWNALARLELMLRPHHSRSEASPPSSTGWEVQHAVGCMALTGGPCNCSQHEPRAFANARENFPSPCPDLDQECCGAGDCVGCPGPTPRAAARRPIGVVWADGADPE